MLKYQVIFRNKKTRAEVVNLTIEGSADLLLKPHILCLKAIETLRERGERLPQISETDWGWTTLV